MRALRYVKPHRRRIALALGCAAASSLLGLVPALALREIVDNLTGHAQYGRVAEYVGFALGSTLVSAMFGVAQSYCIITVSENVVSRLRRELFDHLLSESIAYFTARRAGEAVSRILNDADGIDTLIGPVLVSLVSALFTAVGALVVMFWIEWRLALLTLLIGPTVALIVRLVGGRIFRTRTRVQEQLSEMTAYLHETLGISGIQLIKAFGRAPREQARFAGISLELRDLTVSAAMTLQWIGVGLRLLQLLGPAVLLLVGGDLVAHHELRLGGLLAFSLIAMMFAGTVQGIGNALLSVIGSLALWDRVFETLDHVSDLRERPDAVELSVTRGAISLQHVTFRHPGQALQALDGVDVTIRAGELTALVGPSGAGKTTLSQLVPRFFDPQEGRVLIDGIDVREVTFASLGHAVGIVSQDTYLVHAPLRDNLAYGRPEADDRALLAAASQANLDEVIARLPQGLDTVVGERGHRLSGGEKQRVAIARAILKDPPILILDEATSHLDTVSERLVQAALAELLAERTSLVIAHRLSTVLAADQIIVLDAGRVLQRGTHRELVAHDGLYRRLYETQFAAGTSHDAAVASSTGC